MHYEGTVYRPPSEADSLIVQATVGCPHNRCRFCNMYKDKRFRIRKVEDILEEIDNVSEYCDPAAVRSVFLADGNTVIMRTADLLRILERIRQVFPRLERITSYGASRYVTLKSASEWRELKNAGLTRIHCGMESGHDPLLEKVEKGTTMHDHIEGGRHLREAGIELSMYYLAGLGGVEMWEGHARDSAKVLNAVEPDFIRIRTYVPMPETSMGEEYASGKSSLMEPHEVLRELRLLLEQLQANSLFFSDHWLNYADIQGRLPIDKPRMLAEIDQALALPRAAFRPNDAIFRHRL